MSKKHLFLHIGTEKTGTTSIQAALRQNGQKLREHDIFYPRIPLLGANQTGFTFSFLGQQQMALLLRRAGLDHKLNEAKQNPHFILDTLIKKFEESGCSRMIISSELLHSRITKEEEVDEIKKWAEKYFDEVTVICYLRKQEELMISSFSTMVKTGSNWHGTLVEQYASFLEPRHGKPKHFYDYKGMLDMWSKTFPRLICREFARNKLLDGDVVKDFLSLVDPSIKMEELDKTAEKNTSLDAKAMEFLILLNSRIPSVVDGRVNPLRKNMVHFFDAVPAKTKMKFTEDEIRRIREYFKEDNAYIREKYFNGEPIFEYKSTAGEEYHAGLNTEEAVKTFSDVWEQISMSILELEEENRKLRIQKNTLRSNSN